MGKVGENMGIVLGLTSGKGGVGKSTAAVGLAVAFAELGQRVLLIDADEGLGCLDLSFGLEQTAVLNLTDALKNGDIEANAYNTGIPNLMLICAPKAFGEINGESLARLASKAKNDFDVVIFDFTAGLNFSLLPFLPLGTTLLTLCTPDPVSVRDGFAVNEALGKLGLNSKLVINRFSLKTARKQKFTGIDGIIDRTSLQLLGIVPEDKALNRLFVKHNKKIKGKGMKAFLRIAKRLLGQSIPLPDLKKI